MKNYKSWYEKWYYIIGIITGLTTLLGVSVISIWNYMKDNNVNDSNETQTESSLLYFSEEYLQNTDVEKIIEDNMNFILQQKQINAPWELAVVNNFASFNVTEEAAKVYYYNDETKIRLGSAIGKGIPYTLILLLDYNTNEIIYRLTTNEEGIANYYPLSLTQEIYCIVIAADYYIYVSPLIIFNEKQSKYDTININLINKNDKYTSDFRILINYSNGAGIPNKDVYFRFALNTDESIPKYYYVLKTDDLGYVLHENQFYSFELNTRYVIDVYLNEDGEYKSIDGSLTNTNLVTVQFDYAQ